MGKSIKTHKYKIHFRQYKLVYKKYYTIESFVWTYMSDPGPEIFLVSPTFDNPNKKLLKVTNSTLISTLVVINNLVTHNQM